MAFCTECGARLDEATRFCTECGAPVSTGQDTASPTSAIPSTEGAGQEGVVQVIPNLMRVRGLVFLLKGPVWHHLVVTSERIIIVQKTVKGLERFKQNAGIIGPDHEHFFMKSMKPSAILEENPESVAIPLRDLEHLTVTKYTTYSAEEGPEYYWQVQVAAKGQVHNLRTEYHEDPGEYFRNPALKSLLRERLHILDM